MIVFTDLKLKPKEYVEKVKNGIILNEEESIVFDMIIKDKSIQEIAFKIHKSPRSVFRVLAGIRTKILGYYEYMDKAENCH